nr:hypothetical protein [Tanacetum cinerariifolium]
VVQVVLFANMKRIGKGFSRVETPLFDAMLVQQQVHDDVAEVENDEDDNEEGGGIVELNADEDVTLVDVDAEVEMDTNIQERMVES